MTLMGWLQIAVLSLAVVAVTKPLALTALRAGSEKESPWVTQFLP